MLTGDAYARAPIRYVYEEDGITVLRFENRERRNNTDFAVGQTLTALRPCSYGNLRDSDPEKAIYRFLPTSPNSKAVRFLPRLEMVDSMQDRPSQKARSQHHHSFKIFQIRDDEPINQTVVSDLDALMAL